MRRNAWSFAVFVFALALVLGACGTQAEQPVDEAADSVEDVSEVDNGATPKKLVWVESDAGIPAGWAIETDVAARLTRMGVLETLIRVDFNGDVVPWLAESWERIDDVTWEFQLREDVQFQDGEPLTAEAVVGALEHLLQTPTPPRGFGPEIIAAVEAQDARTVVVRTVEDDELLPLRLTGSNTGILSPNAYGDAPAPDPFGTGTGPFVLADETGNEVFELVANDNYWDGEVGLTEVQVQVIPDGGVRAGMAQSGEGQIVRDVPISSIPTIEGTAGMQLLQEPEPRTETLYLNNESPVLSDIRVRQAILHAVDRDALAVSVLEGAASPATGPFPEWEPWTDPAGLTSHDYDPERAKELLAEAGYGEGELTLDLWTYPDRAYLPDLAVALQEMLGQVGVQADIRVAEYVALETDVLAGDYELFILSRGHLVDMYDPLGFLAADYTCEGAYNLSQFCDPAFDGAVNEAASTEDEEARWAIYQDLTEELQADAANGYLVHVDQLLAVSDQLQGFQAHPLALYLLTKDLSW